MYREDAHIADAAKGTTSIGDAYRIMNAQNREFAEWRVTQREDREKEERELYARISAR